MGTRKFRPTTPSRRAMSGNDFAGLTRVQKLKSPGYKAVKKGGRVTTVAYSSSKGGGHKQRYRVIDFKWNKLNVPGNVDSIQYDPNRTAFIALIHFADGEKRYILSPKGLKAGDTVITSETCDIHPGNCKPLHSIPDGVKIHKLRCNLVVVVSCVVLQGHQQL